MKIFDRISSTTNSAHRSERELSMELNEMERRLAQLPDEIKQAQADVQAITVRRQAIDATVAKLTEQASTGTLDDPARLAAALRQRHELGTGDSVALRLQALQDELSKLELEIHDKRGAAATQAYHAAVQRYAQACIALPALTVQVMETAKAAGVILNPHNSPHLVGAEIQIGGALIEVPLDR